MMESTSYNIYVVFLLKVVDFDDVILLKNTTFCDQIRGLSKKFVNNRVLVILNGFIYTY